MFVMMIIFGIMPPMAISISLAVRDVPSELIEKSYTLGASNMEAVWSVVFKIILPKFMDSIRLQIGAAMVYLIAAEMLVSDVGFGYRIRLQMKLLNMDVVFPYLAILAGFGFLMDFGVRITDVGRIASCASWAPFALVLYSLICAGRNFSPCWLTI